jgi:putative hydrolase of the HAD superfamily
MIGFVYFDAAGTLLRPWPSVGTVYARACRPHGLTATPAEVDIAFRRVWRLRQQRGDRGLVHAGRDEEAARRWWRGLVEEVLVGLNFKGDGAGCFAACYRSFADPASWQVFPEVQEVVHRLGERGLGVGILSNWDTRLPRLLDALGLASLFDPVLVSALEGYAKPDPEIFRRAALRVGLPPSGILHVGDDPSLDLTAAQAAGFHALLLDRRSDSPAPLAISDLRAVMARIAKIDSGVPC